MEGKKWIMDAEGWTIFPFDHLYRKGGIRKQQTPPFGQGL